MIFEKTLIVERIKEVATQQNKLSEDVAYDVAFHMTDWLEDLAQYVEFCADPNKMKSNEIDHLLIKFLLHVPNHIAAASKLYIEIPVTDVFGVRATSEDNNI